MCPTPTRSLEQRVTDGISFTHEAGKLWICNTCGAVVKNYLKHGAWHARLRESVRQIRHLIVANSDLNSEEFVAALEGGADGGGE